VDYYVKEALHVFFLLKMCMIFFFGSCEDDDGCFENVSIMILF